MVAAELLHPLLIIHQPSWHQWARTLTPFIHTTAIHAHVPVHSQLLHCTEHLTSLLGLLLCAVYFHNPWYTTWSGFKTDDCTRQALEPLLSMYGADLVYNGEHCCSKGPAF